MYWGCTCKFFCNTAYPWIFIFVNYWKRLQLIIRICWFILELGIHFRYTGIHVQLVKILGILDNVIINLASNRLPQLVYMYTVYVETLADLIDQISDVQQLMFGMNVRQLHWHIHVHVRVTKIKSSLFGYVLQQKQHLIMTCNTGNLSTSVTWCWIRSDILYNSTH